MKNKEIDISHKQLLALLSYDPETGNFTWLVNRKGRYARKGKQAGYVHQDGYVHIGLTINGVERKYKAHRLAWFYVHGVWPDGDIDHRKLDHADNRLGELREATRSQNMANTLAHKDNRTGVKGISFDGRRGKYRARIMKDGKSNWLGYYPDTESAHQAYAEAAKRLFGEFARPA